MIDDTFLYVAGGECLHAGQGWVADGDKGPIRGREKGFPSYLISLVILGSPKKIKPTKSLEFIVLSSAQIELATYGLMAS